ncbi:MAG: Thiosulfate sulfurtransferase PspE precursor [Betaproteobacteria bacterium ADurb.Bin341]|nr:MAG: Thiosulfate sulfurtransferase PspE precursor [Betaproteobacteria bacterium ADurb.Bin341]
MELNLDVLGWLEPIHGLSLERQKELAGICSLEYHDIGSDPLRGVNPDWQLVYLLRGELRVWLPGGCSCLMVGGCDEANWPLGQKTAFPESSKAMTPVYVMRIDSDLLDIMMTWDQLSTAAALPNEDKPKERAWHNLADLFQTGSLFGGALSSMSPERLSELVKRFERVKTKRNQVILREGDEGDCYYIIESGRCEVTRKVSGAELRVAELKSGDAFGAEALVTGEPRNATVTMKTDGVLWRLLKPDFAEHMQKPLLHTLSRAESERRVAKGSALWIDVRYPAEFMQDGLTGALNIPLNEIRSAFDVLDKSKEYVVYCHSGRRSLSAAFLLAQYGLTAFWLEGGLARDKK